MSDVKFRATTPHTAGRVSHTKSGRSELAWRQSHHSRRAQFFVTCRTASRKPCTNTDCLVALLARRSRSTDGQPCCAVHPCITPSADNRSLTIDILRWQVVATDDLGLHSMCGLCARQDARPMVAPSRYSLGKCQVHLDDRGLCRHQKDRGKSSLQCSYLIVKHSHTRDRKQECMSTHCA